MANMTNLIINKFASILGYERKRTDTKVTQGLNFVPLADVGGAREWTKAYDGTLPNSGLVCTFPETPKEVLITINWFNADNFFILYPQVSNSIAFSRENGTRCSLNSSLFVDLLVNSHNQLNVLRRQGSGSYRMLVWWR